MLLLTIRVAFDLRYYSFIEMWNRLHGFLCSRVNIVKGKKYSERMISICEPFIPKDFVKMN